MEQPAGASQPPTEDADPVFDGRALPLALGGIAAAVVTTRVISYAMRHLGIPTAFYSLIFWTVIFTGLWLTCLSVSKRFGSGNPWRDFGFAWRPRDIWRGAAGYYIASVLLHIVRSPWAGHTYRLSHLTGRWTFASWPAFAVFACSAIVAAPIFEELAFRGMLQRTLAGRMGQSTALVGQAAAFAAYHLFPQLGWENIPYALGLMTFGLVMGWMARHYRRLGAGCTAHALTNTLSVLAVAGAR